jgi:hypothetical protein
MSTAKNLFVVGLISLVFVQFSAANEPTISVPGLDAATFARIQNLISGGIQSTTAPPCKTCPALTQSDKGCRAYYDRMFSDGDFTFGIALGWWDPIVDGSSTNDRFATIVNNLTRSCRKGVTFACGFSEQRQFITKPNGTELPGTSYTLLVKSFKYSSGGKTKTVTARVPVCNPNSPSGVAEVQERQRAVCAAVFAQSMKYDDVSFYLGHSRGGGGPDFSPPRVIPNSKPPKVDYASYTETREGFRKFFSKEALSAAAGSPRQNPAHKVVFGISCSSQQHFTTAPTNINASAKAAGYTNANFDFVGTTSPSYNDGQEPIRLLEAMGNGKCANVIRKAYNRKDDFRFDISMEEGYQVMSNRDRLDTSQLFTSKK